MLKILLKRYWNKLTPITDTHGNTITVEQFFKVIENYNLFVFPMQIIWIALSTIALLMYFYRNNKTNFFVGLLLGFIWIWGGIVYHLSFFTAINKAAYGFGILFIIQGILLIINVFSCKDTLPEKTNHIRKNFALFLIIFAIFIYPVLVYFIENNFNTIITLGLPCPTTILTFGFILLLSEKVKVYLLIIPLLWSLIGTTAAAKFGVYPDIMLIISALIVVYFRFFKKSKGLNQSVSYDC